MKKFKQISAILLAHGVVCSMMAPAGAAADPMNRISDHAGTTRSVLVVEDDGTSVQEHMLNVEIPASATKAEELALIQNSAKQSAGLPVTRSTPTLSDIISTTHPMPIASNVPMVVGEGTLARNYSVVAVTFDEVTVEYDTTATRLNVRIANNHHNQNTYGYADLRLGTYTLVYLKTDGSGTHQDGDTLVLNAGDYITVWSSTDQGYLDAGTVYVSAD